MKRVIPAVRRMADDDRGISIVEVMVAITILAVTMAATASNVVRSLQVARESQQTVIAANIAQFELERLRSIPFADWVSSLSDEAQSETLTTTFEDTGPNGVVYQVYREASWVASGAETQDCSVFGDSGREADYVRVRQVVSFPSHPDLLPVENVTIITPRLDDTDAYSGHLVVMVRDRDGFGSPGHQVRIQGAAGTELAATDSGGCAFFALLPVDPGNPANNEYRIHIDTPGYVDRVTKLQAIDSTSVVAAQTTTVVEFAYDEAVSYDLVPSLPPGFAVPPPLTDCDLSRVEIADSVPTDADDPTAQDVIDPEPPAYDPVQQAVMCLRDGVPLDVNGVPNGGADLWKVAIPYNLGYTLHSSSTDFHPLRRLVTYPSLIQTAIPDMATQDRPDGEICGLYDDAEACISRVLYPYSGGYTVQAGRCPASDPDELIGTGNRLRLPAEPGEAYTLPISLEVMTVTAAEPRGNDINQIDVVPGADVYADMRDPDRNCDAGERLYLGRTDSAGRLHALMPYGEWVFWWDYPGTGGTGMPAVPYSCDDVINIAEVREQVCQTIVPGHDGIATAPRGELLEQVSP